MRQLRVVAFDAGRSETSPVGGAGGPWSRLDLSVDPCSQPGFQVKASNLPVATTTPRIAGDPPSSRRRLTEDRAGGQSSLCLCVLSGWGRKPRDSGGKDLPTGKAVLGFHRRVPRRRRAPGSPSSALTSLPVRAPSRLRPRLLEDGRSFPTSFAAHDRDTRDTTELFHQRPVFTISACAHA